MIQKYEILMLAVPEITQDETANLERQLEEKIQKHKGSMISFDRWGKYKLVYPVAKNDYGVYFLIRFEGEDLQELLKELQVLFAVKLHEFVMRYVVTKLDPKASLVYQRPKSLEETPVSRDVSNLLDSNKSDSMNNSAAHASNDDDADQASFE